MKKSIILFALISTISLLGCKDSNQGTSKEPAPEQSEQQKKSPDADSDKDDTATDDADSDDADSDHHDDNTDSDVSFRCTGPVSYIDMPFLGKVKDGYPCNVNEDCISGLCSENYSCMNKETREVPDDIDLDSITDLADFHPCSDDNQCQNGYCDGLEENLKFCASLCTKGDPGSLNFSCKQDSASENWYCMYEGKAEEQEAKEGDKCINNIYDCGFVNDWWCNHDGKCELADY